MSEEKKVTHVLVRAVPHTDSVEVVTAGYWARFSIALMLPTQVVSYLEEGSNKQTPVWVLPVYYRSDSREPKKGDVLGVWTDVSTQYAMAPFLAPSKKPVTSGGWYECTDGTVSLFRWEHGYARRVRTVADWSQVQGSGP